MIEFNGALTGNALKYLHKNDIKFLQVFFAIPCLLAIPCFVFVFRNIINPWYFSILFLFPLCSIFAPHIIVKMDKKTVPKKVCIEDGIVSYIAEKNTGSKMIDDVYEVHDYGEFYVMTFSAKNKASYFICQKDLLAKGTLEEFEALFEGKIVRMQSN